jgi:hypothetical protein
VGALFVLITAAAGAIPYDPFPSAGTGGALFSNETGGAVDGLLIEYDGELNVVACSGVGADMHVASNADGTLLLEGACASFGAVSVEWDDRGVVLTRAVWLVDGAEVHEIDLHQPIARFLMTGDLLVGETIEVIALGSKDPDGAELVDYTWTWSDGVVTSGYTSARVFEEGGEYTVTLTVTDIEGLTASVTRPFRIEAEPKVIHQPQMA